MMDKAKRVLQKIGKAGLNKKLPVMPTGLDNQGKMNWIITGLKESKTEREGNYFIDLLGEYVYGKRLKK